ncbi:MAG TPA: hypothetical protein VE175_07640 [Woeseiaceae bacterium]|nr:hypothetical protein [Woeseiaceae bacterium]
MSTRREYRRVAFGRKLDVKRLQATLAKVMREAGKDPAPEAAPARLESIVIEPKSTTVYLSGNDAGLSAVAAALRGTVEGTRISTVTETEAKRMPRALRPRKKGR